MKSWLKEGPSMELALVTDLARFPLPVFVGDKVELVAREPDSDIAYNLRGTIISKYDCNLVVELTAIKQTNETDYGDGREIRIVVTQEAITKRE